MEEKYLPIGTIVRLKEATKRIMVIGYCPIAEDGRKFDYIGCLYPEGMVSPKESLLFNHEQVEAITFKGLVDDEQVKFMIKLKEVMKNKNGE